MESFLRSSQTLGQWIPVLWWSLKTIIIPTSARQRPTDKRRELHDLLTTWRKSRFLELVVWFPIYNCYFFTEVRRECGKILRDRETAYPVFFPFVMSRFFRVGFYLIKPHPARFLLTFSSPSILVMDISSKLYTHCNILATDIQNYWFHLPRTKRARETAAMNVGESTNSVAAGYGWLIAKCDYESWIVSTAVLDVSLNESLYSADHQLVIPSAHHDDNGRREFPALVWCDTWGVQAATTHSDSRDNQTGYFTDIGRVSTKTLCQSGLF